MEMRRTIAMRRIHSSYILRQKELMQICPIVGYFNNVIFDISSASPKSTT